MALQAAVDAHVTLVDLAVIDLDQVAERLDPIDVHVAELQLVQPPLAAAAPDSSCSGITPSLPRV